MTSRMSGSVSPYYPRYSQSRGGAGLSRWSEDVLRNDSYSYLTPPPGIVALTGQPIIVTLSCQKVYMVVIPGQDVSLTNLNHKLNNMRKIALGTAKIQGDSRVLLGQ